MGVISSKKGGATLTRQATHCGNATAQSVARTAIMQQRVHSLPGESAPASLFAPAIHDAAITLRPTPPLAQLHAIRAWLRRTEWATILRPAQRAIWIPAAFAHSPQQRLEPRSRPVSVKPCVNPWIAQHARVIEVSPLIRERFCICRNQQQV